MTDLRRSKLDPAVTPDRDGLTRPEPLTEARLEGHPIPRGDVRSCAYPDCILEAAPGDIYCAGCRSGIERADAYDQGGLREGER